MTTASLDPIAVLLQIYKMERRFHAPTHQYLEKLYSEYNTFSLASKMVGAPRAEKKSAAWQGPLPAVTVALGALESGRRLSSLSP